MSSVNGCGCTCNQRTATAPLHPQAAKTKTKELEIMKRDWIPASGGGLRPPERITKTEMENKALLELREEDEVKAWEEKEKRERPWYRKLLGR